MNNMQFGTPMGMFQNSNPYVNSMNTYANRFTQPFSTQQNNGINWVQGIEGAKAWQLAPNSNVMLLDSDTEGRFYIKVSDNVGMCTLRIFDYVEVTNSANSNTNSNTTQIDMSNYVTKSELQEVLNSLTSSKEVKTNGKQSVSADERTPKSAKPTATE